MLMRAALAFVLVLSGFGLVAANSASAEPGVAASPEAVVPLGPGRKVPSATVRTVGGEAVDIADLTRDSGALLVFYRGGW